MGAEQNNYLQVIQRLRAKRTVTVDDDADAAPQAVPAGRSDNDTRKGEPLVFSGDESTWSVWSFKLRSCVSVVDLQLGRVMKEAELAARQHGVTE